MNEYKQIVVSDIDLENWTDQVNIKLAEGWRPLVCSTRASTSCSRNNNGYTSESNAFIIILEFGIPTIPLSQPTQETIIA